MANTLKFDADLIARYDQVSPRYTPYPPVTQFTENLDESDYQRWVALSNDDPIPRPLSLCLHSPFYDRFITKHCSRVTSYVKSLSDEIKLQAALFDTDRIVEQMHWHGEITAFLTMDQLHILLDIIDQNFQLRHDDGGYYSIRVDPQSIDSSTINHLRVLGFNRLSLSVQNYDAESEPDLYRAQELDQTQAFIDAAHHARFKSIKFDLIYGLPNQSVAHFSTILDKLIEINPDRIELYNYTHLPQHILPQRRVSTKHLPTPKVTLDILELAIAKLTQAGYIYIGMDLFTKPLDELAVAQRNGQLHRNPQGYSARTECDLIAMGVSAISYIGDNFSQNTTNLLDYHRILTTDRLPIVRGYELTTEDHLRLEIIEQLLCHFRLDIADIEQRWNIRFLSYFPIEYQQLTEMENDGLLRLTNESIDIHARGQLLVRSICGVFSRYLL